MQITKIRNFTSKNNVARHHFIYYRNASFGRGLRMGIV